MYVVHLQTPPMLKSTKSGFSTISKTLESALISSKTSSSEQESCEGIYSHIFFNYCFLRTRQFQIMFLTKRTESFTYKFPIPKKFGNPKHTRVSNDILNRRSWFAWSKVTQEMGFTDVNDLNQKILLLPGTWYVLRSDHGQNVYW